MTDKIFGIYDVKAGFYKHVVAMKSKGEALRAFTDLANDKQTEIGKHPEDFCLFYLAEFDVEKGIYVNNNPAPESLGLAQEFVSKNV